MTVLSEENAPTWYRSLREAALEALSPTRCAACERPGALICDGCLRRLTLIDPEFACTVCAAPYGELLCTECRGERGPCELVLAAATYDGPARSIIRVYKDGGERRLAGQIAELLLDTAEHAEAAASERYGGILSAAEAVTFVPATAEAYGRRGFDHMEAVARAFTQLTGKPLLDTMVKHGRADQRRLTRAGRREAASSRYEVAAPVAGMRFLLLDDVITTRATVDAAAAALLNAGAARVDALALARVCES